MLEWIEQVAETLDVEPLVQSGATPGRPGVRSIDFLPAEQLRRSMEEADVVVCHGGPGTIAMAVQAGHCPIVLARDPVRGEHVDDHQIRYTRQLAEGGSIQLASDVDELCRLIALGTRRHEGASATDRSEAVDRFGALVDRLMLGGLPHRTWRERVLLRRTATKRSRR